LRIIVVNGELSTSTESSLSFVACISDDELLRSNLLASPCMGHDSPHEVILVRNCQSAADGLNLGFRQAKPKLIACIHKDVYLPEGWDRKLLDQLAEAERQFGPIGVLGVYGVGPAVRQNGTLAAERIGWVVDRGRVLREPSELPARASTLDELLLVVPRETPLRFDSELGFHLYGADLCLQAAERGLAVVALEAPCYHNSRNVGLPEAFVKSAEFFARKWQHRLPVATPCVIIDETRRVWMLGNTARHDGAANGHSCSPQRPQRSLR
jgi:glycosyl transferase family 2